MNLHEENVQRVKFAWENVEFEKSQFDDVPGQPALPLLFGFRIHAASLLPAPRFAQHSMSMPGREPSRLLRMRKPRGAEARSLRLLFRTGRSALRRGIMRPIVAVHALVVGDLLVARMAVHAGVVPSVEGVVRVALLVGRSGLGQRLVRASMAAQALLVGHIRTGAVAGSGLRRLGRRAVRIGAGF